MQSTVDRRQTDRRGPAPFFSRYQLAFNGRRRQSRRANEVTPTYLDHYGRSTILCALAVVVMSAMDAAFTLRLLSAGAVELNSVMAILIEQDIRRFIVFKLALTSLAVLLLVIHHNARLGSWLRVRHIHYAAIAGYALLIGYELTLLRVALM
ncbi:MAG: DUF5658 family protein [Gammaproteobacteria bacterium]